MAILYLEGDIVDGRSQHIPLLDMRLLGSYSMQEQIKHLREDPSVRAVVLRIESPGGSSVASDVMWRELSLLAKAKPLVVSMGTVAASGGYYVASASHDIYALPLTITGSIGVFYGKADLSGLLGKIGVNVDTFKTTPRADGESMFRGFTPEERKELEHKVDQFYDVFLDRVSTGRGMTQGAGRRRRGADACGRGSRPSSATWSITWAACARRWRTRGNPRGSWTTRPSSSIRRRARRCSNGPLKLATGGGSSSAEASSRCCPLPSRASRAPSRR